MGSAGGAAEPAVLKLCRRLGQAVAKRGCCLLTGACPGLPHEAAGRLGAPGIGEGKLLMDAAVGLMQAYLWRSRVGTRMRHPQRLDAKGRHWGPPHVRVELLTGRPIARLHVGGDGAAPEHGTHGAGAYAGPPPRELIRHRRFVRDEAELYNPGLRLNRTEGRKVRAIGKTRLATRCFRDNREHPQTRNRR
jgi:hypothetical protein